MRSLGTSLCFVGFIKALAVRLRPLAQNDKTMKILRRLFPKKKFIVLDPYAVEAILMLDENTELSRFVCVVHAASKKDAKYQIKHRAFVKVGAVANKAQIQGFKNKKNSPENAKEYAAK